MYSKSLRCQWEAKGISAPRAHIDHQQEDPPGKGDRQKIAGRYILSLLLSFKETLKKKASYHSPPTPISHLLTLWANSKHSL
jgi:hypothetical protein